MELHLEICGLLLTVLACAHAFFPRYFSWKEELAVLKPLTRQIMLVHTFFIGLTVLLMGILCLTCTHDLLRTRLGRLFCLGLAVFWGCRFLFQLFVYSPNLWRRKRFETTIHILFSMLWLYLTGVFAFAGF